MFYDLKTSIDAYISHVLTNCLKGRRDVSYFRNGSTSHLISRALDFFYQWSKDNSVSQIKRKGGKKLKHVRNITII